MGAGRRGLGLVEDHMAYYLLPEIESFFHSGLINDCVYTFGPPDDGPLGFTTIGTLAFGRRRVKGNTKLYKDVCINVP